MVDNILAALNSADPAHAADYQKNAEALRKELRQLDADFKKSLPAAAGMKLLWADATLFTIFSKDMG